MAKTPKKPAPKPAPAKALAVVTPAAPSTLDLDISLTHSPHYKAALAFRDRASKLVIADKKSHEGALREWREGSELRRKIEADFKPTKRKIDAVKRAVLDLEKAELAIMDAGLDPLEKRCVEWKRLDDARIEAEATAQRLANEAKVRAEREAEIKAAEDAAIAAEAESPELSVRELWFVNKVVEQEIDLDDTSTLTLTALGVICKQAGYADPRAFAERLAKRPKIREAVEAMRQAKINREQAAALRQEPILTPAPTVEKNTAAVSGVRGTKNYTLDRVADLEAFVKAYKAGELPDEAMIPNEVHLRRMAKDLKEKFPQAYPGCTLKFEEGLAG